MSDTTRTDLQLRQNALGIANQLAATGIKDWQVDKGQQTRPYNVRATLNMPWYVEHYIGLHKGTARVSLVYKKWNSVGEHFTLRAWTTEGDEFGSLNCTKKNAEFAILKDAYLTVAAHLEVAARERAAVALTAQQTRINDAKESLGL